MPAQDHFLVRFSRKTQEVISETENLAMVATTYSMTLPSSSEQIDYQQLDMRQVNLITDGVYVSLREASKIGKISIGALKKLAKSKKLQSKIVDGEVLILRDSLYRYLEL